MNPLYRAFGTDREAVHDGIWHEFIDPATGEPVARMKIRPANPALNSAWRRARLEIAVAVRKWAEEHGVDVDDDEDQPITMPEEDDNRIMAEAYFGAVVTDWEVPGEDGPVPFNRETFVRTMVDLPLLFDHVRRHARDVSSYKLRFEEAAVKS